MKRKFEVKFITEIECKTIPEGIEQVKESYKMFNADVSLVKSLRSLAQNRSLHKWCTLMAQELEEKHIDKREFFKESFFLSWTMDGVKEDVWKPIQKSLTKKDSTTKLARLEEINLIWENINRIIIEKYKGNVQIPPFPSEERMMDEYENN